MKMSGEIESLIPHRRPMLLVDEVVEKDDHHIHCRKTFHADEFFFQGHYPNHPIVPGVILCECAMQAGAILLASRLKQAEGVPVATRLSDVKFKKMVEPGDTIEMHVELNEQLAEAFYLSARIRCDGKLTVRFDFACTMAEVKRAPHEDGSP